MAVTNQELFDIFLNTPNMSDAQIVSLMETRGISPEQISSTFNIPVGEVVSRVAATIPEGMSVTLGDTRIAPQYEVRGSGEDRQVVGIENITVEKTTGDINYKPPVGSEFQNYSPTGEFTGTGKVTSSGQQSFFGGLVDALKDPVVLAALGGAYAGGLFGGTGALGGATAGTVGTTGLTAAEIASLTATDLAIGGGAYAVPTAVGTAAAGLTAAEIAALTAQDLAIGGGGLGAFAPLTAAEIAGLTAADLAIGAGTPSALSGVGGLTAAGAGSGALSGGAATTLGGGASTTLGGAGSSLSGLTGGSSLSGLTAGSSLSGLTAGSSLSGLTAGAGALTGANTLLGGAGLGTTLAGLGAGGSLLGTAATGLGANNLANLLSGGLGTAGNLLQMQQSKEAALAAQQRIDAETAAAKTSAAFRPIGMTTRFGSSQFVVDPVTGQLTSAGYTLSPEAKAAQDRFVKLAEQGIQQAEGAQKAFEPLQTGAERLFELGQGYLAKTPEQVASDYLKSQMALLQPGREIELANLQNRLQQQGRGGLSVAQGGTMGATTPELQALYNARARQEAELAANAQQLGQRDVLFGAGLLGQGAQTMGQYYGGQQASYAPFTTALGQVQGLESMAQQPLQMGASLGQTASTAGARVGALGLEGANISQRLATGANATTNPYAQALMAAGNPNAMFGQSLGNVFGGLFS